MAATTINRNLGAITHLFLTFESHLVADDKMLIYDLQTLIYWRAKLPLGRH